MKGGSTKILTNLENTNMRIQFPGFTYKKTLKLWCKLNPPELELTPTTWTKWLNCLHSMQSSFTEALLMRFYLSQVCWSREARFQETSQTCIFFPLRLKFMQLVNQISCGSSTAMHINYSANLLKLSSIMANMLSVRDALAPMSFGLLNLFFFFLWCLFPIEDERRNDGQERMRY